MSDGLWIGPGEPKKPKLKKAASRQSRSKALLAAADYHDDQAEAASIDWGEHPTRTNANWARQHREWAKAIRQAANAGGDAHGNR